MLFLGVDGFLNVLDLFSFKNLCVLFVKFLLMIKGICLEVLILFNKVLGFNLKVLIILLFSVILFL